MPANLLDSVPIIDRDGEPAHGQIQRWLTSAIRAGQVTPGDRLPSERALATALGVSRMTLRQALAELERSGSIVRSRGGSGGSFVTQDVVDMELTELVGLSEQVRRVNLRAGARVVNAETVAGPDDVTTALHLPSGAAVHRVVRVRLADDVPVVIEDSWFPGRRLPDMLGKDLTGSMYSLLAAYDSSPVSASEVVAPGVVTGREAELLGLLRRTPVLRIERVALAKDGTRVEFSRDVLHPERVRLTVRSTSAGYPTTETRLADGRRGPVVSSSR